MGDSSSHLSPCSRSARNPRVRMTRSNGRGSTDSSRLNTCVCSFRQGLPSMSDQTTGYSYRWAQLDHRRKHRRHLGAWVPRKPRVISGSAHSSEDHRTRPKARETGRARTPSPNRIPPTSDELTCRPGPSAGTRLRHAPAGNREPRTDSEFRFFQNVCENPQKTKVLQLAGPGGPGAA
jgi:hypothetical protein